MTLDIKAGATGLGDGAVAIAPAEVLSGVFLLCAIVALGLVVAAQT